MIRLTPIGKVSRFLLREGGPDKGRTEVTVEITSKSRSLPSASMRTGLRIDSSDLDMLSLNSFTRTRIKASQLRSDSDTDFDLATHYDVD